MFDLKVDSVAVVETEVMVVVVVGIHFVMNFVFVTLIEIVVVEWFVVLNKMFAVVLVVTVVVGLYY